ncbi:MAG: cytidylate kinase-like family protein [Desulfobacterales bacterium]|jgi:cytidylate kinase|nr:cytidylate kinase-like family protein [Desulfobacterales bacterium]
MKTTITRSMEKIVEDQILQWQKTRPRQKDVFGEVNVVTISREYGSGGVFIAEKLAKKLGYDLFHQEIIQEMAQSAKISKRIVKTLDEKGLSTLDEAISALINEKHLWPDQYLRHLMQVISTIGKHGRAVIVGRGAHVILPVEKILRVRVVCPLPYRIKNIARRLNVSGAEARKIVLKTDADRRSFIRKYFYIDASDPLTYDVVINTGRISYDTAVESIIAGLKTLK